MLLSNTQNLRETKFALSAVDLHCTDKLRPSGVGGKCAGAVGLHAPVSASPAPVSASPAMEDEEDGTDKCPPEIYKKTPDIWVCLFFLNIAYITQS
jgi:hypothetical protein